MIGALDGLPGSVMAACSLVEELAALVDVEAAADGRLRNARHAGEVRQRPSGDSFMARRYSSRPIRRSSRKLSLEVVFENQDFAGSGTGGWALVWLIRVVWNDAKSE